MLYPYFSASPSAPAYGLGGRAIAVAWWCNSSW